MSQPHTTPDHRHDGFTPERQAAFLEALAACGHVSAAAEAVGLSRTAVYNLRNRADDAGAAFRSAWDTALKNAVAVLAETAFERAIVGVREPVFYKGEQVGERVRHNDRLLMFLLRTLDPDTYGPRKPEQAAPPTPNYARPRASIAGVRRHAPPSTLSPSPDQGQGDDRAEQGASVSTSSTCLDDAGLDEPYDAMLATIASDVDTAVARLCASGQPGRVTKRNARRLIARQKAARQAMVGVGG